jgi:uncharacterized membrane protein (DUF373 family)
MSRTESSRPEPRTWIARAFTIVEDVVYIGLGVLLTALVLTLLVNGFIHFGKTLLEDSRSTNFIELLDRILLILLIVELLYTVQVSFREHALVPEPFLLVGLISAIRRVLVLTAEFGEKMHAKSEEVTETLMIELAVLTVLILALVFSLVLLRKKGPPVAAERA